MLDAGCGTGFCGPLDRAVCAATRGSRPVRGMLAHARARGVYDELVQGELTAYLRDAAAAFDVIVSADTLVYFGPLDDIVAAAARAASRRRLVFTVEELPAPAMRGTRSARTAATATRAAISNASRGCGLRPEIVPAELRLEAGEPVPGLVVRATKPATGASASDATIRRASAALTVPGFGHEYRYPARPVHTAAIRDGRALVRPYSEINVEWCRRAFEHAGTLG